MTRFFNRGRTRSERGFVLAAALMVAVLYFALMELLLLDSTLQLQQADRFRAHIQATTLAESAAELAAADMVDKVGAQADRDDGQGTSSGRYERNGCCNYVLTGQATTKGVPPATASVRVQGRIDGHTVTIDYSTHSQ